MNNYEIFLKTVETGNITKASKILNYTQSGVSQAINVLEKELGFKLFIRSKKGVTLTNKGRMILPEIKKLVNQQQKLILSANDINNLIKGTIRISAFPSVITEFLTDIISDFKKEYDEVKFEISDGPYENIYDELKQGISDIGFLPEAYIGDMCSYKLYEDEVLAVLPLDHELCEYEKISPKKLIEYPFISQYKGCEQYLDEISENIIPEYTFYDDRVALKMISKGFGVGIITDSMIKYIDIPVEKRSLEPELKRNIYMVLPDGDNMTNLISVFKDHVLKHLFK